MVLIRIHTATELSVYPMGVLLVRKSPFARTSSRASRACAADEFRDRGATRPARTAAPACISHRPDAQVVAASGLDYDAPTDDKPFFFYMRRRADWLRLLGGAHRPSAAPPWCSRRCGHRQRPDAGVHRVAAGARANAPRAGRRGLLAYFGAIGTCFMLIEVSMLRLIIFLGHPVYSLTVLLLSCSCCGVGSYLSAASPAIS